MRMAKKNLDYDIGAAFEAVENELMASMIRNMQRHKVEEVDEDKQWTMWQTEMLKSLEQYKKKNHAKYSQKFKDINAQIEALIRAAKDEGEMDQEIQILKAIQKGFPAKKMKAGATAEFFRVNDRKLEALIEATMQDMQKAEMAILRMTNDQYRKIIYNAQVYANTGAGTYEKAVDMATRDFLSAGINCIEYSNGARHTLADYADMAIRTANKRAYLQGEGQKRQEWGVDTVIMNKRGNPCPLCLPWVGKVLIDDVWSGGSKTGKSATTGVKYPLMSTAIAAGLYHPRCRDSHTTYFEGVSTPPDGKYTKEELNELAEKNQQVARQQYAERQEKRFGRLADFSLDSENRQKYEAKREEWEKVVEKNENNQIEQLEKQFSEMTEGYSYDDFMNDFGSIDDGFEGADEEEILKAKEIADQIEALRNKLNLVNNTGKDTFHSRKESIEMLKLRGIDIMNLSEGKLSDRIFSKYADFVADFENSHSDYFNRNKLQLNSISVVDSIKEHGTTAAGAYYNDSHSIKIMKKAIEKKPTSELITYSRSDDHELHFFAHEYGHYIADSLEHNQLSTDYKIVQESLLRYFDGDIFKTKTSNLVKELGSYGSRNAQEAFAEAFAEAYTCKEPGRFAKIFREELEKILDITQNGSASKLLEKNPASGIMELTRKTSDSREGFKFISDKTFDNLTIEAKKKGAVILRGTEEVERHLDSMNAAASNLNDILFFRKDVCISEVLEETHHFEQNLMKMNDDKGEPLRSILNEIDAKQYLLDNAEKYKIPRNEIELTKKQLASYQQQLKEITGE